MVAVPKGKATITMTLEIDLTDFKSRTFETVEEFKSYFIDEYGWSDQQPLEEILEETGLKDVYQNAVDQIKNGKVVISGSLHSYGENPAETYLYDNGFPENMKDVKIIMLQGH